MTTETFVEFTFEAAHALPPFAPLHGHSFKAALYLRGEPDPVYGWSHNLYEVEEVIAEVKQSVDHRYLNDFIEAPSIENVARWLWSQFEPCIDLDHFKDVNDTLGHPAGDALLRAVAGRLRNCIRDSDVVARLGGDEFAILQISGNQPDAAESLAQRIVESLAQTYDVDGHPAVVGASVGVSFATDASASPDILLKCADMALYRAKSDGRGRYRFFQAEMDAELQARKAIELDPREALGRNQFDVFYQPQFDIARGQVSGFEALLRWRHPQRGMVPPDQFIPIAEELQLIGQSANGCCTRPAPTPRVGPSM